MNLLLIFACVCLISLNCIADKTDVDCVCPNLHFEPSRIQCNTCECNCTLKLKCQNCLYCLSNGYSNCTGNLQCEECLQCVHDCKKPNNLKIGRVNLKHGRILQ